MTPFRTILLTSGLVLTLCGGAAQAQPSARELNPVWSVSYSAALGVGCRPSSSGGS
jgi:hypothetical protein